MFDCENCPLKYLPYELGNLFHLKYLNLKNTKVKELPKSVGKLLNLQTLDLRNTLLVELPKEIKKLENLRHLLASRYDKTRLESTEGVVVKDGIGFLKNLQTLCIMEARLSGIAVVKELKNLSRLRSLRISGLTAKAAIAVCTGIKEMSHLKSLSLHMKNATEMLDLQGISTPPPLLARLVLKGRLHKLPDWIPSLQNLSMLCLSLSRLADDPVKELRLLPNLECLWLYRAYEGGELYFLENCFKKLKLLVLRELRGLRVVKIERGALPVLEELRLGSSPLLTKVPSGIQYLRNLKVLVNCDMPTDFALRVHPYEGSDYWKVEHVPSVLFWYRVKGRRFVSFVNGESDLMNRLQGFQTTNVRGVNQNDPQSSFYYSDVEEEDGVGQFSFSSDQNIARQLSFSSSRTSSGHLSFSSGFYTDDVEE